MTLNRRQLFRLVGAGAALSSLGTTAAVAAQPKFVKPTAEKPMLLCFNENPLGMSEKAKEAVAKAAMYGSRYPFAQVIAFKKEDAGPGGILEIDSCPPGVFPKLTERGIVHCLK